MYESRLDVNVVEASITWRGVQFLEAEDVEVEVEEPIFVLDLEDAAEVAALLAVAEVAPEDDAAEGSSDTVN